MTSHRPLSVGTPVSFQKHRDAIRGRILGALEVADRWVYAVLLDTGGYGTYIETDELWVTALVL